MLREGENECLSDLHILYMLFAFVGLGLYYPLSTFFFPNFQFQDKALDVKYNPSFVVLQMQAKLIIAGLGSLFSSYGDSDFPLILQVSSTATVLFFLAITSAKLKPCLIRKINLWDTGLYLLVGYMNSCALIVLLTYNSTIGIIALTVGGSLIILGTAIIHRKVYGPFNCFGKSNKVRNEEDEVEKEEEKLEEKKREEKEEKDKNEQKSKDEKNKDILADTEKEKKKNKNKSKEINGFGKNIIVKNPEAYRF